MNKVQPKTLHAEAMPKDSWWAPLPGESVAAHRLRFTEHMRAQQVRMQASRFGVAYAMVVGPNEGTSGIERTRQRRHEEL